jgi:molybdate transport system substrate-binding protein
MLTRRSALTLLLATAPAVLAWRSLPAARAGEATLVFAAASLKEALDDAIDAYRHASGREVKASYAASSALARQIEQGAPADILVSADLDWMDYVDGKGLIDRATRGDLLRNSLVLVAPKDSRVGEVTVGPGLDLAGLLGDGRLAVADVGSVPAGKYAKAALASLGAWPGIEGRLAQAENVRAALLLVSRGEAPLGIVYRTDAVSDPHVRVVGTFPAGSHPPIVYPAALTATARPGSGAFLAFLRGPEAAAAFARQGFALAGDARGA